jgi:hypothetical protein
MKSPIQSAKQKDVPITNSLEIVNQGSIPYKRQEASPVSPAPKGRQEARGFGLMMRPVKYLVR